MAATVQALAVTSSNLILLLQIVRSRGDVAPLVSRGLEYSQIAELLREARSVGLIERAESGDVVTEAGMQLLADRAKRKGLGVTGAWIRPAEDIEFPEYPRRTLSCQKAPPRHIIRRDHHALAFGGKPPGWRVATLGGTTFQAIHVDAGLTARLHQRCALLDLDCLTVKSSA